MVEKEAIFQIIKQNSDLIFIVTVIFLAKKIINCIRMLVELINYIRLSNVEIKLAKQMGHSSMTIPKYRNKIELKV